MPFTRKRKAPRRVLGEQTEVLVQTGPAKRYKGSSRKVARRPTKAMKKENKFLDTVLAATEFNYDAPSAVALNLIVQGDTVNNRDGNKVKVTGVQIKGKVLYTLAGGVAQDIAIRLMLVYDKRPNLGGIVALSSVLTSSGVATDVYQLRNRGTGLTDRLRVLKDEYTTFSMLPNMLPANTTSDLPFEWFIPIEAFCEYGANAGANADLQVGLITLYATSNIAAAGAGPTIEYRARVSFEEI